MLHKIKNWWHKPCNACASKKAEIDYWRDMVKHHKTLETNQRNVADTFEKRYDNLIAVNEKKENKRKQGLIGDLTEYLDPLPVDGTERKNVIAQLAGYFQGGLEKQIKHFIQRMEHEVSRFPLTERESDFHRAGINFGHLLLEWGENCVGEHHANIAGKKGEVNAFDTPGYEEEEAVENIKSKAK